MSLCEKSSADIDCHLWGGLSAGSRPLGGSWFHRQESLLEEGCRLHSPPHTRVTSGRFAGTFYYYKLVVR